MTVKTQSGQSARKAKRQEQIKRYLPVWVLLAIIGIMVLPNLLATALNLGARAVVALPGAAVDVAQFAGGVAVDVVEGVGDGISRLFQPDEASSIAPLFTAEIDHWQDDIARWADAYELDPNLLATVMQIESCGHPTISSHAGAQGLFQVMPFHFASDENQLDPDTNAMRGAHVLNDCLRRSNGDAALAMACYNGGPSVLYRAASTWLDEPRRYYYWGSGIYADAQAGRSSSTRLDEWLNAGGARLCGLARDVLAEH
ncbi:MAG: transglycosylase SLT domain-containing protein [Chloroflexota bacterium]